MTGYYRMYRGWMDHPVFGSEPFTRAQAWEWMIAEAAWKDRTVTIGFRSFPLLRGQLCKSIRTLASEWQWDQSKVFRFISRLETEEMIETDNEAAVKRITICNYDEYQSTDDEGETPSSVSSKQRRNSTETSLKKDKKDKKEILDVSVDLAGKISRENWGSINGNSPDAVADAVFEAWFWTHYPERKGPKKPALLSFRRALKHDSAANILAGVGSYLAKREDVPEHEKQFTKHAVTWLNQHCWRDELEESNAN